jgi:hypothetical protein
MLNPHMGGVTDAQLLEDAMDNSDEYARFWRTEQQARIETLVGLAESNQEESREVYFDAIKSFAEVRRISQLAAKLDTSVRALQEYMADYSGVATIYTGAADIIAQYKELYRAADRSGF